MFKVKNITKVYKSKEGITVNALTDISIDFGDKGLVFLLGKSGSGKSTLLNLLGGLDAPTSGEIIINRRSSATFSGADFDNYRNTYVGIVFQEYNLIENYTAGVNIGLALELQGKKADKEQIDAILRKVGLADSRGVTLYNRRVNELSGGQKQRVAIARALIKKPEIILADEPTGALDNKTGESLYELFKELSKEKLVIVVTHDKESAEKYGDRIIELADGEIVSDDERVVRKDIDNGEKDCNFIKSRLSLKRSVALGISALKVKPMRLIATILLSVMALSIFGFSLSAGSANLTLSELQMLNQNNQRMVTISGHACDSSNITVAFDKTITERQLDIIKQYNNGKDAIKVSESNINLTNYLDESIKYSLDFSERKYERIVSYMSTKLAEIDPETGEEDANLTPDSRFVNKDLCRLPQTADEIAITDLYANIFITYGYVPFDKENAGVGAEVIDINTPDDLIGKEFGGYTICGVYSTEQNLNDYNDKYNDNSDYTNSIIMGAARSYITYGFICKGYSSPYNYGTSVLVKLSGDIMKDNALIGNLTYKIGNNTYTTVHLDSLYSGLISAASFMDSHTFTLIMAIVTILFSIFSILLLTNFLSVSLDARKKEFGIMHALGARKSDLFKICLSESLLVAGINFVLSIIASVVICFYLNISMFVSVFFVNFSTIFGLLLLCLATTFIATLFVMKRLAKKNPIEIITNK